MENRRSSENTGDTPDDGTHRPTQDAHQNPQTDETKSTKDARGLSATSVGWTLLVSTELTRSGFFGFDEIFRLHRH